jgi:hypothetical protein
VPKKLKGQRVELQSDVPVTELKEQPAPKGASAAKLIINEIRIIETMRSMLFDILKYQKPKTNGKINLNNQYGGDPASHEGRQ